jgi:hypothetical protein
MFQWLSRLLHWRQGNEIITRGTMTQFIPYKGVYVIARRYQGHTVVTIINGTRQTAHWHANRYAELLNDKAKNAREVTSDQRYDLTDDFTLSPRQTLVVTY